MIRTTPLSRHSDERKGMFPFMHTSLKLESWTIFSISVGMVDPASLPRRTFLRVVTVTFLNCNCSNPCPIFKFLQVKCFLNLLTVIGSGDMGPTGNL